MSSDFLPGIHPPQPVKGPALWFIFQDRNLLLLEEQESGEAPFLLDPTGLGLVFTGSHYMGLYKRMPCIAAEDSKEAAAPPGMIFQNLRSLLYNLEYSLFLLAGQARHILDWDKNNRICGACGRPMALRENERAKECPACGLVRYPRLSPAIIVGISKGEEILLARPPHFPPDMYSVLAGFVEVGETLEETVAREVKEETGILVKDIKYFGSQPWPFPDSLMIAFTANYSSGQINTEADELEHAAWFSPANLPRIPNPGTISRQLIDAHVGRFVPRTNPEDL